jgi:transposase
MEISTSALRTVAAERAPMFVALELSKSTWLVALYSPVADKVSQHRFAGGDVDGLLALIARKQAQAEVGLGQTIRILSCCEAGYDGFWLHRLLRSRHRQPRAGRREHPRRPAVAARQDRSA